MADSLIQEALGFPEMPEASAESLDRFSGVADIDPGEAQIYALATELQIPVLTGDKRALKAVSALSDVCGKLDSRVLTLEAVLLGLSHQETEADLRARGQVLAAYDQMAKAVFASSHSSLGEALDSYFNSLKAETKPLKLLRPPKPEATS